MALLLIAFKYNSISMKIIFTIILSLVLQYATAQQTAYSVKYQQFWSQAQQLSMAYRYEKAARTNGKTVLLLHGKNFSGEYWQTTMQFLLGKGYDVIAPDQIGFGNSSMLKQYQ